MAESVWGDFAAKDGRAGGMGLNEAWDAGFNLPDPICLPQNGSIEGHILVPDTVVIPAPGALTLACTGLGGLSLLHRRKALQ